MTVLEAIRAGNHCTEDIGNATGLPYVDVLARVEILAFEHLVRIVAGPRVRYHLTGRGRASLLGREGPS